MMPVPDDPQGSGSGTTTTTSPTGSGGSGGVVTANLGELERACRSAIDKIKDAAVKLQRAGEDLAAAVQRALAKINDILSGFWASVVDWFTDALANARTLIQTKAEEIRKKIEEVLAKLDMIIAQSTPVVSLFVTAQNWVRQVETPLSSMPPNMKGSGKIDNWRGPARITYDTRVADQIEATNAVVSKVKATAGWLGDIGEANTAYMADLAGLVGGLANSITVTIIDVIEAVEPTQIPNGLSQISELIGQMVETEIDYVAKLGSRLASVFNQITKLDIETGDQSGIGGQWPQTVKVPG